jgi:hypothetical protein
MEELPEKLKPVSLIIEAVCQLENLKDQLKP